MTVTIDKTFMYTFLNHVCLSLSDNWSDSFDIKCKIKQQMNYVSSKNLMFMNFPSLGLFFDTENQY